MNKPKTNWYLEILQWLSIASMFGFLYFALRHTKIELEDLKQMGWMLFFRVGILHCMLKEKGINLYKNE